MHQRRIQGRTTVAQILQQGIAAAIAAQCRLCLPAAGHHHLVAGKGALIRLHRKAGEDLFHPAAGNQAHAQGAAGVQQQILHRGCPQAVRIYTPQILLPGHQTEGGKEIQHRPAVGRLHIGQIAPAVAGSQQLFARLLQPLQHRDLQRRVQLPQPYGTAQSRCAAAHDQYPHIFASLT